LLLTALSLVRPFEHPGECQLYADSTAPEPAVADRFSLLQQEACAPAEVDRPRGLLLAPCMKASFRRLPTRRTEPFAYARSGFSLSSFAERGIAICARSKQLSLLSQGFGFLEKANFKNICWLETTPLLHDALLSAEEGGSASGVLITDKYHGTVR
jgi:hypothetical protein